MIRFECDYLEGAAPQILEAIAQANYEQNPGYGCDPHTERACELIREACKTKDIAVCFVVGGRSTEPYRYRRYVCNRCQ